MAHAHDYDEGYERLATAIVKQAFVDLSEAYYFKAIGELQNPKTIDQVKVFLISDWFQTLTSIDPYVVDAEARRQAEEKAATERACI